MRAMALLLVLSAAVLSGALANARIFHQVVEAQSPAAVTLSPSVVVPQQTITVSGSGFTTGGNAFVNANAITVGGIAAVHNQIRIDTGGRLVATILVPVSSVTLTPGTHKVVVTDNAGLTGETELTILGRSLSLEPLVSEPGSYVQLSGSGFVASRPVTFSYGDRIVASADADTLGKFQLLFRVPTDAAMPSRNTITATSAGGGAHTIAHTVPGGSIAISPASVLPGSKVEVSGTGFPALTPVAELSIGGVDVRNEPAPSTDAGGTFKVTRDLPELPYGVHRVKAKVGDVGGDAELSVVVCLSQLPCISIRPGSGYPKDTATVTGSHFPPASTVSLLTISNIDVRPVPAPVTDASGKFTASIRIPTLSFGTHQVAVTAGDGGAITKFNVRATSRPPPSLTIDPTSGTVGSWIRVVGNDFPRFASVTELRVGGVDVTPTLKPASDDDGTFRALLLVPKVDLATQPVFAVSGGASAYASFTVTAEPPPTPAPQLTSPVAVLAPMGSNLERIWSFEGGTWQMYDPSFPFLSDLTSLRRGRGYWVRVKTIQSVTLGAGTYGLTPGWNLIGWLG